MSRQPIEQLRSLGDEDPDSVFDGCFPIVQWQEKQVVPVDTVNVYSLVSEMYRLIESQSPSLQLFKTWDEERRKAAKTKAGPSAWDALLDNIGREYERAERLEDYHGGW